MPKPVLITEILRRADTGVSVNPFLCRTEDGRQIYVKPAGTLSSSLVSEWLGSRLAAEMRLPVAAFTLVDVPVKLVQAVIGIETSGLSPGIGFGSYDVGHGSRDMEPGDLERVPELVLSEVLAFDLWIQNADRCLTQQGGNPNVVIEAYQNDLFLIDHDNAFDPDFSAEELCGTHLGWRQRSHWLDATEREIWESKAKAALEKVPTFWEELPELWRNADLGSVANPTLDLDLLLAMLGKLEEDLDSFWKTIISS